MTAVIETFRKEVIIGDIKVLLIQSSAVCATGHTIDLGSDTFAGAAITEICLTLLQDDAGADKDSSWDPDTGIITLGTIVTGIHNIAIIGY